MRKIRRSIEIMVEDGISPMSIVFSHGQMVTPDEAEYLKKYEIEYEKKQLQVPPPITDNG